MLGLCVLTEGKIYMNFKEVLKMVHEWFNLIKVKYENEITFTVEHDDKDGLYVIMENPKYVGGLIVDEPGWAPYNCASFEIHSIDAPIEDSRVFLYYDDEQSTKEDILSNLNKGLKLIASKENLK